MNSEQTRGNREDEVSTFRRSSYTCRRLRHHCGSIGRRHWPGHARSLAKLTRLPEGVESLAEAPGASGSDSPLSNLPSCTTNTCNSRAMEREAVHDRIDSGRFRSYRMTLDAGTPFALVVIPVDDRFGYQGRTEVEHAPNTAPGSNRPAHHVARVRRRACGRIGVI